MLFETIRGKKEKKGEEGKEEEEEMTVSTSSVIIIGNNPDKSIAAEVVQYVIEKNDHVKEKNASFLSVEEADSLFASSSFDLLSMKMLQLFESAFSKKASGKFHKMSEKDVETCFSVLSSIISKLETPTLVGDATMRMVELAVDIDTSSYNMTISITRILINIFNSTPFAEAKLNVLSKCIIFADANDKIEDKSIGVVDIVAAIVTSTQMKHLMHQWSSMIEINTSNSIRRILWRQFLLLCVHLVQKVSGRERDAAGLRLMYLKTFEGNSH